MNNRKNKCFQVGTHNSQTDLYEWYPPEHANAGADSHASVFLNIYCSIDSLVMRANLWDFSDYPV